MVRCFTVSLSPRLAAEAHVLILIAPFATAFWGPRLQLYLSRALREQFFDCKKLEIRELVPQGKALRFIEGRPTDGLPIPMRTYNIVIDGNMTAVLIRH